MSCENWYRKFIKKLRREIAMQGLTQMEVAEMMGVTQSTVSSWLNHLKVMQAHNLLKAAYMFGIDLNSIVGSDYEEVA